MTKTVLVTGASKGIGKAIAIELARQGFHIVVHYLSDKQGAEDTLQQVEQLGVKGRLLCFDVSVRTQCQTVLNQDIQENGSYYGIVLNAGIIRDAAFPALTEQDWDSVIHTNLDAFYNVIQPAIMPMISARQGGRIVTLASVSGLVGNRGQVNYSASKSGLIGATKALALELAKRKITVNCVAPGLIDTGMINEETLKHAMPLIPMRRMGQAQEVSDLVAFLMSDKAAYITRQVISINGGMV
ncbi:3-ketoacyl-ACP reductase [Gallibacterium salpingitidis]|uniref:3-ketoacyl-ACP reductase n=1 Tax=Gallibacterium salpingitidis TaxID=505341 RepID=A0A1A7P365_9PAST|nr:3-ketoacyl-ACP reductase FabG2 [Gallibacterium salpingitidis]OBW96448.1 3-ketoacyl-ACP reductase [Gallibacterium salpingitidis]OBX06459.1 3-ketoacyl-ACP reductase [Gallibacterium salpingitidis]OBX08914.1 3-ketoacyl-ACP reductase [Gallibacterium salpingitidis]WKS99397.1 3-ketoacyl-ACP reductase FabG2 [Gallibacterium salpingitidis]